MEHSQATAAGHPGGALELIGGEHTYVPSLDGIRAVSIAAAMFFHLPAPPGHWGIQAVRLGCLYSVDMFFILSGFLITWILAVEVETSGTLDLGYFYQARILRLVPAYVTAIALRFAVGEAFRLEDGGYFDLLEQLLPYLLTYTLNIWMAITAQWPLAISHFWSLCVEEQFYLSWALILKRWGLVRCRSIVIYSVPILAIYRLGWYLVMNWGHLGTPSRASVYRIYYATDTRIAAILVGCALALMLRDERTRQFWLRVASWPLATWISAAATLGCIIWVTQYRWRIYAVGDTLVQFPLSALFITIFLQPRGRLARLMAARPLVSIGRISYGIYLFHMPILLLFAYSLHFSFESIRPQQYWPMLIAYSAVSVTFAALHYHFIERRFLALRRPRAFMARLADRATSTGEVIASLKQNTWLEPPGGR